MTFAFELIVAAIIITALAPLVMFLRTRQSAAQNTAIVLQSLAAVAGLAGSGLALGIGGKGAWLLDPGLPFGPLELGLDPLSALFLLPVFLVAGCCAVYALRYWPAAENADAPRLTLYFGILTAALAGIVIARHAIVFLIAWEVMTISCYLAMSIDSRKKEVREAGLLYLVTAHAGVLALFAFFALMSRSSGSFAFPAVGTVPAATAIFFAALVGFGLKAGLMPLHIWLPSAHANAPSHVSALMSGVLIKMGIYGLVRTVSFFDAIPFSWGITVLVLGVVSGIGGVIFAIGQHDIKRLLAYHSIENIGIIAMGIGIALMGLSHNNLPLVMLGLAGALLHTLNHAIFKSLLFLGAGSVIHACGTREIDRLGGLLKRMPYTAACFLTGAAAICGLPPLNGFVSELLVYIGLFRGIIDTDTLNDPYFALAAPALALIGGLAVACFVKVFGIVFLGAPREDLPAPPHEAGQAMLLPMGLLAGLCLLIGLLPPLVAPLLERAAACAAPLLAASGVRLGDLVPLGAISIAGAILLLLVGAGWLAYRSRLNRLPVGAAETWGCGYLAPTPRMQYTSSSFAATLVDLFSGILRPHRKLPVITDYFPKSANFRSHVPEALLEGFYLPLFKLANDRLSLLRRLQHGKLHLYILYIVLTLLLLLGWSHFRLRG